MIARLIFGSLCLSAALAAFAGGCFFRSAEQKPPGYVSVGIESYPGQLDPRFTTDANSSRVSALVYSALLRPERDSELRPDLATSWRKIDERTYLFEIRPGVVFHDGTPLTARDVKYTYDSILDPATRSSKRALLGPLASVEEAGPYGVRFRLSAPHAPFLEQCTIGIVPAGTPAQPDRPPPGSGPFIVETIRPGEKVVLRANPRYWEGRPRIDGLAFHAVPDAMVRVLEFKKGTIDLLQNDIEPDMLPWLRRNTAAAIETRQGTTFQYVGVNLTHPILGRREVRQALAYAIDRERIIRHLLKNLAAPATGLLSPLHWAYDPSVPQRPYDPEKARSLLDRAGFRDPDGDGPRPRFRLSFKTTNIDLRRRIAEALKEQLQRVGIELDVRAYEWGTFYGDVRRGNFHLFSLAWVGVLDPDIYYNLFHSSSVPPNGDNRGRYANAELDRLLERGRASLEREERKAVYRRVQRLLAEELPYIPLWWWKNVVVSRPDLRGVEPYPNGDFLFFKNAFLDAADSR